MVSRPTEWDASDQARARVTGAAHEASRPSVTPPPLARLLPQRMRLWSSGVPGLGDGGSLPAWYGDVHGLDQQPGQEAQFGGPADGDEKRRGAGANGRGEDLREQGCDVGDAPDDQQDAERLGEVAGLDDEIPQRQQPQAKEHGIDEVAVV